MDCFKHTVLVSLLEEMVQDSSPFTYIDTHAARGIYDLESQDVARTLLQRDQDGVHRLSDLALERPNLHLHPSINRYLSMLHCFNNGPFVRYYLGSPGLAVKWLRPQDNALLFELAEPVHSELQRNLRLLDPEGQLAIEALQENSFKHLGASPPKFCGRGLVLMDPPAEPWDQVVAWSLQVLKSLQQGWPGCCVVYWYPCLGVQESSSLYHRVRDLKLDDVLVVEMNARSRQLGSSGVFIVNPPDGLAEKLKEVVLQLDDFLERSPNVSHVKSRVFWI